MRLVDVLLIRKSILTLINKIFNEIYAPPEFMTAKIPQILINIILFGSFSIVLILIVLFVPSELFDSESFDVFVVPTE